MKFIAPRSLGSKSDTTWSRKNYNIEHSCGGMFGEGDTDSLYRGVFFGNPFIVELNGCDGDWSVYNTSSPSFQSIVNNIKLDDGSLTVPNYDFDLEDAPVSTMPQEMKDELAIALLTHHNAQYERWQREEEGASYYY